MKICDLHTHSNCSDGSLSPSELVALARRQGLSAVALTDHNTAAGLDEFTEAGKASGMITVAGCEFTSEYNGRELHVVGLFFPKDSWREIEDFVELMRESKRHANRTLIENLRKDGYDVFYDEAASLSATGDFNRAHIARVLLSKGQVQSVKDAFDTILAENGGYYVPAKKLGSIATVKFIKMYGGAAVLAHPLLSMKYDELSTFLPDAIGAGLDAIETRYSEFSAEDTRLMEETALRYGLLKSGGSDFHGAAKPDIMLGTGKGDLVVPFEFCEALKARIYQK